MRGHFFNGGIPLGRIKLCNLRPCWGKTCQVERDSSQQGMWISWRILFQPLFLKGFSNEKIDGIDSISGTLGLRTA